MSQKIITYNGFDFNRDDKTGYYLSSRKINGKRPRLHRYVWEMNNGNIPKGCHVHHKDQDKSNNDISNLELLTRKQHLSMHANELMTEEAKEKRLENMKKHVLPSASKWHGSKEGREWHKEQYKVSLGNVEDKEFKCEHCGIEFKTKNVGKNRFCSNKCKSAYRRKTGVDNVEQSCIECSKIFTKNKYSKIIACSRSCGGKYAKRDKGCKG